MSRDQEDEQTDVHVEIDASALRADEETRENVRTMPAPPDDVGAPLEEDEKTQLSAKSRLLKVIVSIPKLPSEPPLDETLARAFPGLQGGRPPIEVPPTVPLDFVPENLPYQGRHRDLAGSPARVRIVSNAAGQAVVAPVTAGAGLQPSPLPQVVTVNRRANAPTAIVASGRKGTRWGLWIALFVLAALLVAGAVREKTVLAFAHTTIARLRR